MTRKRPHYEREELLQVFLLGMFAAKPQLMDGLEAQDFTGAWAECVAFMEKARKAKDSESLYRWLESHLGVKPANGTKTCDAALERFRQDAAFRKAEKVDQFSAQLARLQAEMTDRRLRKE